MEWQGVSARLVAAHDSNIKITSAADLLLARRFCWRGKEDRSDGACEPGCGPAWGSTCMPSDRAMPSCWRACACRIASGIVAHSDGDVLLHALVDALLGAAALGDIGSISPTAIRTGSGADSARFVLHACELLAQRG